jgi:hypothetical protein
MSVSRSLKFASVTIIGIYPKASLIVAESSLRWYWICVRRPFLTPFLGLLLATTHGFAQQDAFPPNTQMGPPPLQSFTGTGSSTTATFVVQPNWEIKWSCPQGVKITIYSGDKTAVAAVTGPGTSMYLAAGGTYYLQIDGPTPPPSQYPDQQPQQSKPAPIANTFGSINDPVPNSTNNQQQSNNQGGPNNPYNRNPYQRPGFDPKFFFTWHVSVVGQAAAGSSQFASYTPPPGPGTPNGNTPGAATPPAPATPPAKLTEDQARAVVLITGDNAVGTGFLIKTLDGPFVVTNLHVIGDNPNLKITTSTGAAVKMLSAKGASDRDLAMLSIEDAGYNYLDVSTDISKTVQPGDQVITPGNSQGGGVMLNTCGKVLGIGPERIEFDNPIYHGNSGGPVFHVNSNKVLGVVTEAMKVDLSNSLDKTSFSNRQSAISSTMRYFGLRLDTVTGWIPIDWTRFQTETTFLEQFDKQSRALDSYLNPPAKDNSDSASSDSSSADANLYLDDKKIMAARDSFRRQASGTDGAQRIQAFKELLFDLNDVADSDMTAIQNMDNFYPFDRPRAKDEIAYRKALKSELDDIGTDVNRLNGLAPAN